MPSGRRVGKLVEMPATYGTAGGRIGAGSIRLSRMLGDKGSNKRKWLARVLFGSVLVLAWQLAAAAFGPLLLPGLLSIGTKGIAEVVTEGYYVTFLKTLRQLAVGFAIACSVAIPLGGLVGYSKVFADLIQPYVYGLYVAPNEALLPLLIILFGTGLQFRVAIVILFSAFFLVTSTATGVSQVDRNLKEAARSLCTPPIRFFRHFLLPASTPFIITGLRLGLGMAFNAMILAELWLVTGTGGLLTNLANSQRLAPYFAVIALVAVASVGTYIGLGSLERHLRKRHGLASEGGVG